MSEKEIRKDSFGLPNKQLNTASQTQNDLNQNAIINMNYKIIQSRIQFHISNLFSIIKAKLGQNIPFAFNTLTTLTQSIHYDKSINETKTQIILFKIDSSIKILFKYYSYNQRDLLRHCFFNWVRKKTLGKEGTIIKRLIEEDNQSKVSERENAIGKTIHKKDREIAGIKAKLNIINENLLKYNKTIKTAEDKENVFIKNIKRLEEDNMKLDRELKEDCSNEDEKKEKYDVQLKELTDKAKVVEEEFKEKFEHYSSYLKHMDQIFDMFERKIKQMNKLKQVEIASNFCKSPSITQKRGTYTLNSYNGVSTLKGPLRETELNNISKGINKNSNNSQGKTYTISTTTNKSTSLGTLISAFGSNNCSNNPSKR